MSGQSAAACFDWKRDARGQRDVPGQRHQHGVHRLRARCRRRDAPDRRREGAVRQAAGRGAGQVVADRILCQRLCGVSPMRALPFLALLLCAGPAVAAPQFATIYAFLDGKDGATPEAVTAGPDGALYGTTSGGGKQDHGTVFKLSPSVVPGAAWTKETLY